MSQVIRSIRTNVLEVAYEESGPGDGETIVLIHGWPDSVRTWDAVIPALVDAGYRCVTPYLRGFGATRFLDSASLRIGAKHSDAVHRTHSAYCLQVRPRLQAGANHGHCLRVRIRQ